MAAKQTCHYLERITKSEVDLKGIELIDDIENLELSLPPFKEEKKKEWVSTHISWYSTPTIIG